MLVRVDLLCRRSFDNWDTDDMHCSTMRITCFDQEGSQDRERLTCMLRKSSSMTRPTMNGREMPGLLPGTAWKNIPEGTPPCSENFAPGSCLKHPCQEACSDCCNVHTAALQKVPSRSRAESKMALSSHKSLFHWLPAPERDAPKPSFLQECDGYEAALPDG